MATPLLSLTKNPDGTLSSMATFDAGAINWVALFHAVVAALPVILSIVAEFTGKPTVPVPPPPAEPHA